MKCFLLYSKVMLRVVLLFLVGSAALTPARADNLYARIHGTATDSSGAVLPDVTVVAFNTATGQIRTVSSDGNGNFEFIQLPIGTYKVSAGKNGFKKWESSGITLVLDQNYALPIQMEVGSHRRNHYRRSESGAGGDHQQSTGRGGSGQDHR